MTLSITASVGDGGVNRPLDVAIIQSLINSAGIPAEAGGDLTLAIDGQYGPKTNAAICNFQFRQFAMQDGLVQPDDFSMKCLNALEARFRDPTLPGSPLGLKHFALLKTGFDMGGLQGEAQLRADGVGMAQRWDLGSIYHHPLTGAFEVHGAILGQYIQMGEERSALGYPISDERDWVSGGGRFSHFQFGTLLWTPAEGVIVMLSPGL